MLKFILSWIIFAWFLALVGSNTDTLSEFREQAAKVQPFSEADFELGKKLAKKFTQLALQRKRMTPRPLFIAQAVPHRVGHQYFVEKFWNDRMLFANRLLWEDSNSDFKLPSLRNAFKNMQLSGFDGMTTWAYPGYQRAWKHYLQAASELENFKLIVGLAPGYGGYSKLEPELAMAMYEHPVMLRINNLPVVRSYWADRACDQNKFAQWAKNFSAVTKGRDFYYMSEVYGIHLKRGWTAKKFSDPFICYCENGAVPATLLLHFYDYLSDWLRLPSSGGLCFPSYEGDQAKKHARGFFEEVQLPLYGAVLAQAEFNGKKMFTANFKCGYSYPAGSQSLSRNGTKTLRDYIEPLLKFRPDVLIGSEWDELNEDTSLGPTVVRPMSSMRILRYYTALSKGEKLVPLPNDNENLPNLIVSQRRELSYGWDFELELLNVPDRSDNIPYVVTVELVDHLGEVVKQIPEISFNSNKLFDHTITLPSELFSCARLLRPRLTITRNHRKTVVDGLPFTSLRPMACDNHSWYCTPVRNLLVPQRAQLNIANKGEITPGVRKFQLDGEFKFDRELSAVELLQNHIAIYAWDLSDETLSSDGSRQLYTVMLTKYPKKEVKEISIKFLNAPSVLQLIQPNSPMLPLKQVPVITTPQKIELGGENFTRLLFSLKKEEIKNGILELKIDNSTWQLSLNHLGEYGVVSHNFPNGILAGVETTSRPKRLPLPLKRNQGKISASVIADLPEASLVLRAVSSDGKVWYSSPRAVQNFSDKSRKIFHATSDLRGPVQFTLPEMATNPIVYHFTPDHGQTLICNAGREYYAQIGGNANFASNSNGSRQEKNTSLSNMFYENYRLPGFNPAVPWVKDEQGRWYLHFDGRHGGFIMLPRTAVPQRSGFRLEMEIRPDDCQQRNQQIWAQFNSYATGFQLFIRNGRLGFRFDSRVPFVNNGPFVHRVEKISKLKLTEKKWQRIVLSYNCTTLTLIVDDKSESLPLSGIGRYLSVSGFGGFGNQQFKGDLRMLAIYQN